MRTFTVALTSLYALASLLSPVSVQAIESEKVPIIQILNLSHQDGVVHVFEDKKRNVVCYLHFMSTSSSAISCVKMDDKPKEAQK